MQDRSRLSRPTHLRRGRGNRWAHRHRELADGCETKGSIRWVLGAKALQDRVGSVVSMVMLESRDTTTLVRDTEEHPSGAILTDAPVACRTARSTDPVIVSMTEPRIVFVGLPPAPAEQRTDDRSPNALALLRPERRVQIGWDAGSGSYRLGLTF